MHLIPEKWGFFTYPFPTQPADCKNFPTYVCDLPAFAFSETNHKCLVCVKAGFLLPGISTLSPQYLSLGTGYMEPVIHVKSRDQRICNWKNDSLSHLISFYVTNGAHD
jgi:hypothetical protein